LSIRFYAADQRLFPRSRDSSHFRRCGRDQLLPPPGHRAAENPQIVADIADLVSLAAAGSLS
jgi:hypothetical protein